LVRPCLPMALFLSWRVTATPASIPRTRARRSCEPPG
jgi:hypothetical protein